jgi:hypothetical protein
MKNTIYRLQKDDVEIEGENELLEHVIKYYEGPFGSSINTRFGLDDSPWPEK